MIDIKNRRYIGNKQKLLTDINEIVREYFGDRSISFADLFAGTGVVGYHFAKYGHKIIVNDILYSNYIAYKAWFSNEKIDVPKIITLLNEFNKINATDLPENYFSNIYGGKYYSVDNAKIIGHIREKIEAIRNSLLEREYYILLTSLMYFADRIANTVGHFESFLNSMPVNKKTNLEMLSLDEITDAQIELKDANLLAKQIVCDVAYIDPPYNARQYVNFYHVLENLARWEKPIEFEGHSMKFKRNHLKSGYSRTKAPELFKDLINSLDCKLIIVSYNNTYSANSSASNNKITQQQLIEILSKKGIVTCNEIDYNFFNAGKTNFSDHKEKLYICKVKK